MAKYQSPSHSQIQIVYTPKYTIDNYNTYHMLLKALYIKIYFPKQEQLIPNQEQKYLVKSIRYVRIYMTPNSEVYFAKENH